MAFTAVARRRFLVWGCAGVLVCLALCILATRSPATLARWDQAVQIGPDWWRAPAPWLEGPLLWVSYAFGTVGSMTVTALAVGVLVAHGQRRAGLYLGLVIVGTFLVNSSLKMVVDLPRPVVEDPILQYASSAMPSGHASNIAAAGTAACVLSALFVASRVRRRVVMVVAVLAAVVVGLDRLMLGVHTLTQVLAGYALGVGIGLLTAYFVEPAMPLPTARVTRSP